VVCCTPLEGAGVLEARIGPVIRAEAIVRTDDATPGKVTILDWKLCGRGGC
jgi:selenophosphate synthetase-related protein